MTDYTPTEQDTTTEKIRLIDLVRPELKEHGLVDLTDFVNKKSSEGFKHPGFVRSLAYRIEEIGLAEVIVRKEWTEFYIKRNIYSKRHPIRFAFILGSVGIVFALIAGGVNSCISNKLNTTRSEKQLDKKMKSMEERQEILSDSLATILHVLEEVKDTLAKYK